MMSLCCCKGSKPLWRATHIHTRCIQSVLAPWCAERMSIWVHSYAVIHVWMTVNFRENRARLGLKDVAMKWLRLQPLFEYVSHIRIGCRQSVLAPWCVVAEHNMGSLTFYLDTPLQVGGGFWGFGGRPEPMWWCNVIVKATTGFRLDPTSILDVYKVF